MSAKGDFFFLFTLAYFNDNFLTSDWPEVMYLDTSLAEIYCRDFMVRLLETELVPFSEEERISHQKCLYVYFE